MLLLSGSFRQFIDKYAVTSSDKTAIVSPPLLISNITRAVAKSTILCSKSTRRQDNFHCSRFNNTPDPRLYPLALSNEPSYNQTATCFMRAVSFKSSQIKHISRKKGRYPPGKFIGLAIFTAENINAHTELTWVFITPS